MGLASSRLSIVLVAVVVAASAALAGCAHDVAAVYPSRGVPAGTVVVELTGAAEDLTVVVGGALVASHEHSRRVVVSGVPEGRIPVDVAFGGGYYARAEHHAIVDVVAGTETTIALPGPERSTAGAVESVGTMIYLGLVYAALLA